MHRSGGAIGAGLFVGSGGAFQSGGPAAVIIGFTLVGIMIYLMMQALAELAVMYPINGKSVAGRDGRWTVCIEQAIALGLRLTFCVQARSPCISVASSTRPGASHAVGTILISKSLIWFRHLIL